MILFSKFPIDQSCGQLWTKLWYVYIVQEWTNARGRRGANRGYTARNFTWNYIFHHLGLFMSVITTQQSPRGIVVNIGYRVDGLHRMWLWSLLDLLCPLPALGTWNNRTKRPATCDLILRLWWANDDVAVSHNCIDRCSLWTASVLYVWVR